MWVTYFIGGVIMEITFKGLKFNVSNDKTVGLTDFYGYAHEFDDKTIYRYTFPEFDTTEGNMSGRFQKRGSAQTRALRYVSHTITQKLTTKGVQTVK